VRAAVEDLYAFGKRFTLLELTDRLPADVPRTDPMPVLPVRLWQDGAFLFAASAPSDPDHHLRLLEQHAGHSWQWLPLVGPDFPLASYAQRGPLLAWTPHLAGVALKIDRKTPESAVLPPLRSSRWPLIALLASGLVLIALLAGNLWSTLLLHQRHAAPSTSGQDVHWLPPPQPASSGNESRERFAAALAKLLRDRGAMREGDANRMRLLARYDRLVRERDGLRLNDDDSDGKLAVAQVAVLADRNVDHIEEVVQKALAKKGFDDRLVKLASELVREQFASEGREEP
jgi:hypothetical protein